MKYGVLVSSSQTLYESSGLYINNNTQSRNMLYNPFLIFDSNRRNGLNKKHP